MLSQCRPTDRRASPGRPGGEIPLHLESNQQLSMPTEGKIFALAIHGGAGAIERSKLTPDRERDYRAGLERSLHAGYDILKKGRSSLDAVEAAVRVPRR